jgi:hypothetical protein
MEVRDEEYRGWCLESISVDTELFTTTFTRNRLGLSALDDLQKQRARLRMIFVSFSEIAAVSMYCGAEILSIKQDRNEVGDIVCRIQCLSGSSMTVTAKDVNIVSF